MNESKDNKYENKYLEIALMVCYFLIPFFGFKIALKNYLREDNLSIAYIALLLFVGGNIMTVMIFILNEKNLIIKSISTTGLLLFIILINFIMRQII